MFASKAPKAQTKALENSFSKMPERSALLSHRLGRDPVEQALLLQRTIGNQATLRLPAQQARNLTGNVPHDEQEADPASVTTQEKSHGVSWDFGKIPRFPPERASCPGAPPSFNVQLPVAIQPKLNDAAPLRGSAMQRKLIIGPNNDPLEREADAAADQVMTASAPAVSIGPAQLSRKCVDCEEDEPRMLQPRRAGAPDAAGHEAPATVDAALRSPGRPLDGGSAAFFGTRFGHDFARVRIHSDSASAKSARSVAAQAYTVGEHIVFGSGEYAPATDAGRKLLAHELAHVVQQDDGRRSGIVQRREVDDRSCAGLSDVESEIDSEVNAKIGAARTAAGASPPVLLDKVYQLLGAGVISPIEDFIEALPAAKRSTPAGDLSGTKYSGAGAANRLYKLQTFRGKSGNVVASAANVHGQCIGADKLGHFFDLDTNTGRPTPRCMECRRTKRRISVAPRKFNNTAWL